jgi:hypothetical protein
MLHQTVSQIFNHFFISGTFVDKNYPIVIAGFVLFCSRAKSILFCAVAYMVNSTSHFLTLSHSFLEK